MSFPRYPKYKDSGVEWLGEVPEHWDVKVLKHIVSTPITDGPHETPDFPDEGIPFVSAEAVATGTIDFTKIRGFISTADHDRYSEKYRPRVGDVYMVKSGATTGVTAIVETDADFNIWSPLAAIRCGNQALPRFVLNFMRSRHFQEAVTLNWSFGTQQNIGMRVIENLAVSLPPVVEQSKITTFLDRETAKIDELVAEQQRLIELLKEKRQAVISHAVTKGLNPDAPMKPSGIEWLGDVPEHWDVTRLKHATSRIVDCPHDTPAYSEDGDFLVIRTSDLDNGVLFPAEMQRVNGEEYFLRIRREAVLKNDIVYSREGGRWGHAALIDDNDCYCLGQRMMQFRANQHFVPQYLMLHLNTKNIYRQGEVDTAGAASPHVNVSTICNYRLAKPPFKEQWLIVEFLKFELGRLDELTAEAQCTIDLLQERRTALISAAVTGKIDVRGLVKAEAART